MGACNTVLGVQLPLQDGPRIRVGPAQPGLPCSEGVSCPGLPKKRATTLTASHEHPLSGCRVPSSVLCPRTQGSWGTDTHTRPPLVAGRHHYGTGA